MILILFLAPLFASKLHFPPRPIPIIRPYSSQVTLCPMSHWKEWLPVRFPLLFHWCPRCLTNLLFFLPQSKRGPFFVQMIVFLDQLKTFLKYIQDFVSFLFLIFSQSNSFLFYQQPLYVCAFLHLKLEMWSSSSCINFSCWVGTSEVEDLPIMHRTLGLLPSKTKITRKTKPLFFFHCLPYL